VAKLVDKAVEFLDGLAWKLSPHPAFPKGEISCNISDETAVWNRQALDYAWKPGGSLNPLPIREIPAEEMRRRQEETYASNQIALDYAHKNRKSLSR
jgi:hypothetical protein